MLPQPVLFAFLPQLGMPEMVVVMVVAILLFGKRLPEVGRSLGKGIIEFKKGLRGLEDGFDFSSNISSYTTPSSNRRGSGSGSGYGSSSSSSPYDDSSVPKFEPPTSPPVPQMEYQPEPPTPS
ncbi:MAG: twin-arginine translocase TatA/TatE family subunit [Isosphaeraceae bacterium]